MLYNQPYGITDPDAPYINGNPSTGTMGSIPPAASIEHPQREIVNFIGDAQAVTPSAGDLHQLSKTVQSAGVIFGIDIGSVVNNIILEINPIPDTYTDGMKLRFRAIFSPSGGCTVDAGRGARPLLKSNGGPITGGEWTVGDIIEIIWDLARNRWQLPVSPYTLLYANKDYYVDDALGKDTNDGLTPATAFQTLQRAQNATKIFNINGYQITIHVAPGSYAAVSCGIVNGTGVIYYLGDRTTPSNCVISTGKNNVTGPCFTAGGQIYYLDGFKVTSPVGPLTPATPSGVYVVNSGLIVTRAVEFGFCLSHHFVGESGGFLSIWGPVTVSGGCNGSHLLAINGSFLRQANDPSPITLNVTTGVTVGSWVGSSGSGVCYVNYAGIQGFANVTGSKYTASANGVIIHDAGGINYYPGTIAGSLSTGGQYL